jgi:hypothetical protein
MRPSPTGSAARLSKQMKQSEGGALLSERKSFAADRGQRCQRRRSLAVIHTRALWRVFRQFQAVLGSRIVRARTGFGLARPDLISKPS